MYGLSFPGQVAKHSWPIPPAFQPSSPVALGVWASEHVEAFSPGAALIAGLAHATNSVWSRAKCQARHLDPPEGKPVVAQ